MEIVHYIVLHYIDGNITLHNVYYIYGNISLRSVYYIDGNITSPSVTLLRWKHYITICCIAETAYNYLN